MTGYKIPRVETDPENMRSIEHHLEEFLRETNDDAPPFDTWDSVLAFCLGYYGEITVDHIAVVRTMEIKGKLRRR